MPKKLTEGLNARIMTEIARHPEGIGIDSLHEALREFVSRRTLQRRLSEMTQEGRISAQGEGRARIYRSSETHDVQVIRPADIGSAEAVGIPEIEVYVPVSAEGQEVRDLVRRPAAERRPVGYQREFLDDYVPNRTAYLPESVRQHLHHIGRPPDGDRPAGTYARQILDRLLIDLSWASSQLEGNTYSRLDTERLIKFGQAAEGKDAHETQMILNHKATIEFLVEQAEEIGFNRYTLLNLHALLSENLLHDPQASGRLRRITVDISGTVFHPLAIPQVIEECFQQLLDTAAAITDPFEQAFLVMVHLPYLQPFEDVNKRVSRLAANISLIQKNLCPLSFVDVPERAYVDGTIGVYELCRVELLRDVFVWAYERSVQRYLAIRQSMAQPDPFRLRYREALIEVIGTVVRERRVDDSAAFRTYASHRIPVEDREKFVEVAVAELDRLHEGVIARYRLRPTEFNAWKQSRESAER